MNSTFSVVSLGCARALVDSEQLVQSIQTVGFSMVPEGTNETVTVLNTCSFIQDAIDETEANIDTLIERKKKGAIQYICVVGCYPSRFSECDLTNRYPDVDIWCTTKDEATLHQRLAALVFHRRFTPTTPTSYTKLTPSHYAYLKISEGCNNWCTFCTIPSIRGKHTSLSIDTIRHQAQIQLGMGAKELILIAEDTTAWGEDLYGKPSLDRLIHALSDLDAWIRLMYIFPSRVNDSLITAMADSPNVIPYIDMPIQHVHSQLLAKMNRRHTKDDLCRIITDMRSAIPNLALRTTFICGFPGETEAHVEEVCDFLTEYRIDHIGCFTYSKEANTRAATFQDPVDPTVAKQRVNTIMTHHHQWRGQVQLQQLGSTHTALYDGNQQCRTVHQAPDVDNVIVLEQPTQAAIGDMISVRLTGVSGIDFTAKEVT